PPLTYTRDGVRDALRHGLSVAGALPDVGIRLVMGSSLAPAAAGDFGRADARAKRWVVLKRSGYAPPEGLGDEADDGTHGGQGPKVRPAPPAARSAPPVHFGHQERSVGVDRLDIADVALWRGAANTHPHDGADARGGSLGEAERPRVPPPLGGIAAP